MANVIKIRKGLDIKLKGKAVETISSGGTSKEYAIVPDNFHGVKPKVVVRPGDKVKAGTVLFYDKNCPEVKFVSPVSGEVTAVNRGERRKVLDVTVKADDTLVYEEFKSFDPLQSTSEEIRNQLLASGVWAYIKQRPYDIVANPNATPKAIFVSAFDSAPLAPNFEFVLKGQEKDFQTGLNALSKLATVYLGISGNTTSEAIKNASNVTINQFDGPHPVGNVGVQINHIAPINKGEIVWTIGAQDVIIVGRLFNKGIADFSRMVALTGSEVVKSGYYKTLPGAKLDTFFNGTVVQGKTLRYIDGNVLTGTQTTPEQVLSFYANQLTVIPEGNDTHEAFGWIMPRFNQFSTSHSYFSWLTPKKEYTLDARIKGGERAIIMSNEYDKVFPMDILPEFLIKAILAKDIDQMEALGIYEVAPEDFALCEFVDTSKLELQKIVREGLDYLKNEMN